MVVQAGQREASPGGMAMGRGAPVPAAVTVVTCVQPGSALLPWQSHGIKAGALAEWFHICMQYTTETYPYHHMAVGNTAVNSVPLDGYLLQKGEPLLLNQKA